MSREQDILDEASGTPIEEQKRILSDAFGWSSEGKSDEEVQSEFAMYLESIWEDWVWGQKEKGVEP